MSYHICFKDCATNNLLVLKKPKKNIDKITTFFYSKNVLNYAHNFFAKCTYLPSLVNKKHFHNSWKWSVHF